jgi:hexosaminidase
LVQPFLKGYDGHAELGGLVELAAFGGGVGGDEALKHEWAESPEAQQRMAELGLHSENELQSWFIAQMSKVITAAGRRLIGWDEIHEGGLAPGAAVMFWHGGGKEGLDLAVEIARSGHDVVMAPAQHTYFDYYQAEPSGEEPLAIGGMLPAGKVYAFDPMPPALAGEGVGASHILGGQGQLWTEYIPSFAHLQYMAFPRACALAETLWLDAEEKSFRSFLAALPTHRRRLQAMGMNCHPRP